MTEEQAEALDMVHFTAVKHELHGLRFLHEQAPLAYFGHIPSIKLSVPLSSMITSPLESV